MCSHQLSYTTNYCHGLPCSTDCTPLSDSLTLGVDSIAIVVRTGFEPVMWLFLPTKVYVSIEANSHSTFQIIASTNSATWLFHFTIQSVSRFSCGLSFLMGALFVTRTPFLRTVPLVITGMLSIFLTRSHRVAHRSQDRNRTWTPHYRERDTAPEAAVTPICHLTIWGREPSVLCGVPPSANTLSLLFNHP